MKKVRKSIKIDFNIQKASKKVGPKILGLLG